MGSLCAVETTACPGWPGSGLICEKKDRFLLNVAIAGDNLHDNDSIEASAEHPTDRIRNAGGGRIGHKQAG